MQEKIKNTLGLDPVDKEVVVLYDGERNKVSVQWSVFIVESIRLISKITFKFQSDAFWEGKRIIEMEKPRPNWFHPNLLQKTTAPNAETKEVKPSDLG